MHLQAQVNLPGVMEQGAQPMEPRDLLQTLDTILMQKRKLRRWSHAICDAQVAHDRLDETRGSADGATRFASKSRHRLDAKKGRPTDGATRLMTPQLRRTGVMKQGAQPMEPRHLHCNCDTDLMQKRRLHRWSHAIDDATIAQNRCDETRGSTDGATTFALQL